MMTNLNHQTTTEERFRVLIETLLKQYVMEVIECERKVVAKCKQTGNVVVFAFKLDTGLYDVKQWELMNMKKFSVPVTNQWVGEAAFNLSNH